MENTASLCSAGPAGAREGGEDSEEPAARPGLLPGSQAGLGQAGGLSLFAHPKNY